MVAQDSIDFEREKNQVEPIHHSSPLESALPQARSPDRVTGWARGPRGSDDHVALAAH